MATQNEPRISSLVLKCVILLAKLKDLYGEDFYLHGGGMCLFLDMLAPKELGTGPSQTTQGLAAMLVLHHTLVLPNQLMADDTTP